MRDCTCLGVCKGAEGLGAGWRCALTGQPERGLRVDPVDGTEEGVLCASTETVLSEGVPSPAVEQGRLQAIAQALDDFVMRECLMARMTSFQADVLGNISARLRAGPPNESRAALSVEAPAANVSTNLSAIADGQFASDADVRASSARMMAKHRHSLEKMSLEAQAETKEQP